MCWEVFAEGGRGSNCNIHQIFERDCYTEGVAQRWLPLHETKTHTQAVRSSKNSDRSRRPREIEVVLIANSSSARRSWRQTVPSVCWFFVIPFKRPVVVIASANPVLSTSRLTKKHVRLVMKRILACFLIKDCEGHCTLFKFGVCTRRVTVSG